MFRLKVYRQSLVSNRLALVAGLALLAAATFSMPVSVESETQVKAAPDAEQPENTARSVKVSFLLFRHG